jgi:hypothetical protein
MVFDNVTGETKALSTTQGQTMSLDPPAGLPTTPGSYLQIDLSAEIATQPAWKEPITTHFRRTGQGWTLVGLERMRERVAADPALKTKASR